MEGFIFNGVVFSFLYLSLYFTLRVVYTVWWVPKRVEKQLREQGIGGTSYKLLYGDLNEMKRMTEEARSKPLPLTHQIVPRVAPFIHQMVQNYGKISMSWGGTKARLIIVEAEAIRQILNDKNGNFRKPPLNPLVSLLTLGISTLEGDQWAIRRRLINPAFHHHKILGMVPAFLTSCRNLVDGWNKLVDAKGSYELDIFLEFQQFAGDVIARAAFGSSYQEGKQIFDLQKEQAKLSIEAFQTIYIPGFRFIPTKRNKRQYEIDNAIKSILRDMIHKKEQSQLKNGESISARGNDDLLGQLLQSKGIDDNELTIEDIIEECKLFYLAGQETTASLLTWTLVLLSMNPNWQDKARQEVLQLCGNTTPNVNTLNHLKIVSMVLHEVLRMYPPITGLVRQTCRETSIGGMSIPAGVELHLQTLPLHYDLDHWGEDAEEFKPERFANGISKASKDQVNAAFYPFGWGPRICLGQSFAMLEAKMALTVILQHFSFELSPSYTHAPHTGITLQPQHGAPIILHPI